MSPDEGTVNDKKNITRVPNWRIKHIKLIKNMTVRMHMQTEKISSLILFFYNITAI